MQNTLIAMVAIGVLISFTDAVEAQRRGGKSPSSLSDDIMKRVLQNSDANRDGKLSASETSGRTKDFIRKAGLDPNRAHSIGTILQKAKAETEKAKSNDSKNGKSDTQVGAGVRKVPGFGVEAEKVGVADFSPGGEERMTVDGMNRKFGSSIMSQVERTITRYDTDKNGLIDPNEQKRTRWTNPSASESDTNKDGNLSRLELAYRYKNREDAAKKRTKAKSKVPTAKIKSTTSSFSNRAYSRGSSSSRSSSKNRNSKTSSSKPFNSGSDAYIRYAEGLLKNYDKNKDQKLSRSELKEMRRPPENADSNGDGFVDKNELIASVSKRSSGRSTKSTDNTKQTSSKSNTRMASLRRESKSSDDRDVFGGKDSNRDGQLQMYEFENDWDAKKIAEFKEKDLNGDGVITAKEWHSRTP